MFLLFVAREKNNREYTVDGVTVESKSAPSSRQLSLCSCTQSFDHNLRASGTFLLKLTVLANRDIPITIFVEVEVTFLLAVLNKIYVFIKGFLAGS